MAEVNKRSSLHHIAKICGVSKMTVSRVLRHDSGVADSTRDMVMRVAAKENYFPSSVRKSEYDLQGNRYYIIFQQDYTEKGSFFSELILSIQRELFNDGLACSFGVIKKDYSEFLKLFNMMQEDKTDGVLVVGDAPIEYLNILLESFSKVVFVDYPGDGRLVKPYNAVVFNNAVGCYKAVEHLLKLGRRRVLLATGTPDHYFSKVMLSAYKDALADNGIEYDSDLYVPGEFLLQSGYQAVEQTLEKGVAFDAVFSTDLMACGVINALRASGKRVPEDVSVIGFDGLHLGEAMRPALSTVSLDRERMGKMAVKRLLASDEDEEDRFITLVLLPGLVIRQSCGAETNDVAALEANSEVKSDSPVLV